VQNAQKEWAGNRQQEALLVASPNPCQTETVVGVGSYSEDEFIGLTVIFFGTVEWLLRARISDV
jgi:hypothetical protein